MIQAAQIIGTGVGIGVVFGALTLSIASKLTPRGKFFSYAILGFTLVSLVLCLWFSASLLNDVNSYVLWGVIFGITICLTLSGLAMQLAIYEMPVPGRRCPTCVAKGITVWVLPESKCPQCGTLVN